ncbi:hypothetical protein PEP31012_00646 [Pandoraea eparura]|uniref:Uncharacterized protein n=1 Tax=Pandoraea eparura TaxID=2508291 RepID=A0A5E4S937_9BURK|nr:hypothetical protein PEP31012_00646 [Pandoraea eparura]
MIMCFAVAAADNMLVAYREALVLFGQLPGPQKNRWIFR